MDGHLCDVICNHVLKITVHLQTAKPSVYMVQEKAHEPKRKAEGEMGGDANSHRCKGRKMEAIDPGVIYTNKNLHYERL